MTPELKERLLLYYAEQEQEAIDIRHKEYLHDMQKYLRGETSTVRHSEKLDGRYLYSKGLDRIFYNWQEAIAELQVKRDALMADIKNIYQWEWIKLE